MSLRRGPDPEVASSARKNLLWLVKLLATSDDEGIRDTARAVDVATHLCELSDWSDPKALAMLATSYAGAGKLSDAVRYQTKAVELADEETAPKYREQLTGYLELGHSHGDASR